MHAEQAGWAAELGHVHHAANLLLLLMARRGSCTKVQYWHVRVNRAQWDRLGKTASIWVDIV
jgi:hypothetical protein